MRRRLTLRSRIALVFIVGGANTPALSDDPAGSPVPLAGTALLEWTEEDLSGRLMDGAHEFVERKIDESIESRHRFWHYDFSTPSSYTESIESNRERLQEIIGAEDPRVRVNMERFGDDDNPALVADAPAYRVFQVR